jgi:hypothetical protein
MSHYLKHLVMRNLEKASDLSPRPTPRYESVRQNPVVEFLESRQERSLQDLSSWNSPIESDISHVGHIIERSRQADANLPREPGRELIKQRQQNQSGLFGEKSDESEITRKTQTDPARAPHEVSHERAAELVSSVPRPNTVLSDRCEASASPIAQRSEALAGIRNREVQTATDSLRPTLKEDLFQPVRGEMMAPRTETRVPVVQIRIGRIEVRAVEPSVPVPSKRLVEPPRSTTPLDQYLRRRSPEA